MHASGASGHWWTTHWHTIIRVKGDVFRAAPVKRHGWEVGERPESLDEWRSRNVALRTLDCITRRSGILAPLDKGFGRWWPGKTRLDLQYRMKTSGESELAYR